MDNQNIYLRKITPETETVMLDILTSDIIKQTYMLPDFACREDAAAQYRHPRVPQRGRC